MPIGNEIVNDFYHPEDALFHLAEAFPQGGAELGIFRAAAAETKSAVPAALAAGRAVEAEALQALGLEKSTEVLRPTSEQINSAAFKTIVGDAKYTSTGLLQGTTLDRSAGAGYAEFKAGISVLNSTYQLRLQTYFSLVNKKPLTIFTNRPAADQFADYLRRWGVTVAPLP